MDSTNKNPIFSIKNFRSFGEDGADFEFAPITVLTEQGYTNVTEVESRASSLALPRRSKVCKATTWAAPAGRKKGLVNLSPASEPKRRGAEYSTSPQLTYSTSSTFSMANHMTTSPPPDTGALYVHREGGWLL